MHKKTFLTVIISLFVSLFFVCCLSTRVEAKTISSPDFNVTVGDDEYVYALLRDVEHDGEVKKQIYLKVGLNSNKNENSNPVYKFVWTHKFELYQNGVKLWEEIDVMPKKEGDTYTTDATFYTKNSKEDMYFSKEGYLFVGFDIDATEEYTIKFYNSFSCVDCPSDYEYKEQTLETVELKLVIDTTAPTVDQSGFNGIVKVENGVRKIVNGSKFNVTFDDVGSGVKESYYLFSDIAYTLVDDVISDEDTIKMTSGQALSVDLKSSSYGEGFITLYDFFGFPYNKPYYVFFIVIDNCENIFAYRNDFALYIEKDKDNIEYTGTISEEGTYRTITLDITPSYDTYYSLSDNPFELVKTMTSKYNGRIDLGNSENGEYYLHLIQYDNDGNMLKMTRKYILDNTGPSVDTTISSIPVENTSYKSVTIGVHFKDTFKKENQEFAGVGVDKGYYKVSDTLINEVDYASIDTSYILGSKVSIEGVVDGTYYVYFRVLDTLGNEAVYHYTYIIDNTAPLVSILDYSNTTTAILDPYVSFNVTGGNTAVYRCGWFEEGVTPTYSQLTLICNPNTKNYVTSSIEGNYRLWIYASDKAGNDVYEKSPVVHVDRKGPSVTVSNQYDTTEYLYSNQISIQVVDGASDVSSIIYFGWSKVGTTLTEENITSMVENGVVNYPIGYYGAYNLYIKAADALGNKSVTKIDYTYYIDTDAIVLNIYGDDKITIIKNARYDEEGASAYKSSNKSIKVDVIVEGKVDTSKAGKYVIKYIAGEGELQQIKTRTIIVKEVNQYYVITISTFGVGILTSILIRVLRDKRKKV